MTQDQPPQARPQAKQPQGATGGPSNDILYQGRRRHSASIGQYSKWIVVSAIGSTLAALLGKIDFFATWPLWALGLVGVPGMIYVWLRHVTTKYTLSLRRVECEQGIIAKSVDSLELWRVLDVRYTQSLFDRITGNAKITLIGTDQSDPELLLHGLPEHRKLFEQVRDAVQVARQGNRPMEFVGQDGWAEHMGDMG
jgi:uncharacterized membrane protein YdbT with pleckstrin-like domain